MNSKIDAEIREAIEFVTQKNIKILRGPWFDFGADGEVLGCDPIGAVLLRHNLVPEGIGLDTNRLARPGFVKSACDTLGVDGSWLYRFWMGFDYGYQVTIINNDEKKTESKDEISAYGIALYKEFSKRTTYSTAN